VTTNVPFHSPEIDYLVNGVNGVIVGEKDDLSAYADRVSHILLNDDERERLIYGCRVAREKYTIEEMVERFTDGILKALRE